jgi:PAS domain S-box-containing protein
VQTRDTQNAQDTREAQALRASEARKAAMLETALDAIVTIDHEGRILEFNPAAERMFGYSRAEVSGREMAELLMPPHLREAHRHGLARYVATGEAAVLGERLELTAMRADGTEFPVELSISRIPLDGPPLFTGYIRDITERAWIEEAQRFLAASSTTLASSLDYDTTLTSVVRLALPFLADWCYVALLDGGQFRVVAVAHMDPAKETLAWELQRKYPPNPDLTRPGGFSTALRTGKAFFDPEVSEARQAAHAKDARHMELLHALDATSHLVAPLVAHGQTLGVMVFFSAASRRRYGLPQLALAEEVARRAAVAVDNARLYQQAQEGIRLRDEFLSVAAHELKTPMTTLLARVQLARRVLDRQGTLDPERAERTLRALDEQTVKLGRLVNQLLDVARIEAGKLVLERVETDVVRLITEAVAAAQVTTSRHEIILRTPPELHVVVDPLRLEQVVMNLLSNAIKFSPDGGSLEVDLTDSSHATMTLSVRDHGEGIPVERREHVFDRFYQAHMDAHRGGMGLGLAISRQIVTLHGGTINAEHPDSGGTRFVVNLPITLDT